MDIGHFPLQTTTAAAALSAVVEAAVASVTRYLQLYTSHRQFFTVNCSIQTKNNERDTREWPIFSKSRLVSNSTYTVERAVASYARDLQF